MMGAHRSILACERLSTGTTGSMRTAPPAPSAAARSACRPSSGDPVGFASGSEPCGSAPPHAASSAATRAASSMLCTAGSRCAGKRTPALRM